MIEPITWSYIEYAAIIIFACVLERFLRPIKWLRANHSRGYAYFSYASLVVIAIGLFGTINYSGQSIVMIRSLNGSFGHLLNWVAVFLVTIRFGYRDITKGVFAGGYFGALHELIYLPFVFFSGGAGASLGYSLEYYSVFVVLLVALIIGYRVFVGKLLSKRIIGMMVFMLVFDILWAIAGFPMTIDLNGATALYSSAPVNLVEVQSWVLPALYIITAKGPKPVIPEPILGEGLNTMPIIGT